MKKTFLRASAFLLLLLLALPLFQTAALALENDPDLSFSVSASYATNGPQKIDGSGEIHSTVENNIFNFNVKDKQRGRSLSLVVDYPGGTVTKHQKYLTLECKTASDYGVFKVRVLDNDADGKEIASFEVDIRYDGEDSGLAKAWKSFARDFTRVFIDKGNYKLLLRGLGNTLLITFFSLLMGFAIGTVVAAIRSTYDKNKEFYKKRGGAMGKIMGFFNALCQFYLTIIRGTPVVVQLLIMYFIIFAGGKQDILVAIIAFGINSGAYVAEILRGGIMSVDAGQFEAGRSLGLNYLQTMVHIVIPQAFRSILPALGNEFISLLKETSVAGYVPIVELTKAGNSIRGSTFSAFMPLIAVALIYLVLVIILTKLVGLLERRLRRSDH